ncbi:TAXI family TRAP transporter solute-binding subunit [Bacillus dakarensis]|uniref:TAXI family TRAP transporter solute-binding subunit n=1 Tax=Robertmurraya dakarensis TaxID=1926278 RepID=UPI000981F90F|nr:TAXI family TRAP transporter solute-binding subunit [Bacillus dakarensis]
MRKLSIFMIFILTTFIVSGCSGSSTTGNSNEYSEGSEKSSPENITMLTGDTGGTYYVNGAGVSELVNSKFGDQYNVTVQSTGGSLDNMIQVSNKQADLAYGPSTVLKDAYNGDGSMYTVITEPHEDLRIVWNMYPMPMHLISLADSGIETVSDLKGKRVASTPGAGVASFTDLFERYFGLKKSDFEVVPIGFSDGIDRLKEGSVDVLAYYAGAPTPSVMELMSQEEVNFISFPEDSIAKMVEENPVYVPYTFNGDDYEGLSADVQSYASSVVIFAHSGTSEDVVYTVAKTINENIAELTEMHSSGEHATLEKFTPILKNPFIPLHPGTEKYLEEIGHK